jgi:hypothetical protein
MTLVQKAILKVLALLRVHTSSSPSGLVTVAVMGNAGRAPANPRCQSVTFSHKLPLLKKVFARKARS